MLSGLRVEIRALELSGMFVLSGKHQLKDLLMFYAPGSRAKPQEVWALGISNGKCIHKVIQVAVSIKVVG